MGTYGSEHFKTLLLHFWFFFHQTQLFLNVPCNNPHKSCLVEFWNFKFTLFKKKIEIWHCAQWKKGKIANITWMANRRGKRSENLDSRVVATCIWNTFHKWGTVDLLVFKVNSGSFGALVSKWPATQKRMTLEWSGAKFGTRGYL